MAKAIATKMKTRPVGQGSYLIKSRNRKSSRIETRLTNKSLRQDEPLLQVRAESPFKASPMRLKTASPEETIIKKADDSGHPLFCASR
ncbi:hypothetical protein [Mangrovibacterium marinum]|uniref:hypothetical protein n=1 Tax=Mangrovibacterium marinum TaxID=1639118 RepID=UPI0011B23335|nr:hypothetical protein [Mangrovibacterium marinum]